MQESAGLHCYTVMLLYIKDVYSVEIGNKEFLRKQDRGIIFVSENSKRNMIIQVHLHVNQV